VKMEIQIKFYAKHRSIKKGARTFQGLIKI